MNKSPWDDFSSVDNIYTRRRKGVKLEYFSNFNFQKHGFKLVFLVIVACLMLWFASGIYVVKEGEKGLLLRFGAFSRISYPGLNYHLPWPLEKVIIEQMSKSRRIEIGYRSNQKYGTSSSFTSIDAESIMLTGDENIVLLHCDIMWHINNIENYIFFIQNPETTVKAVAQSVIREVVAEKDISSILSNQKQVIADQIEESIQSTLDKYHSGVKVEQVQLLKAEPPVEVRPAFIDVQTSRADKAREINQAQAYRNNIIPKARGESAQLIQASEAYKQENIERALGDSKRFTDLLVQYKDNKDLMKQRIYLDTIEKILTKGKKVIVGSEMLPHLAIDKISK